MEIRVLLFAQVRMAAERSELSLALPPGADVAAALKELVRTCPALEPHLPTCRAAVGVEYADPDQVLADGDELSLIPPVQGG